MKEFWFAVLLVSSMLPPVVAEGSMEVVWEKSGQGGFFVPMSRTDWTRLEHLFSDIIAGKIKGADVTTLGFEITRFEPGILALGEQQNQGRGFYLFRNAFARPVFLQMPHRYFDKLTGEIGLGLFQSGKFAGAAWNTRHRQDKKALDGAESDLAHIDLSPFTALGRAIARSHPDGVIVQLHGFSPNTRKSSVAKNAELIISSGSPSPSWATERLASCLAGKGWRNVALYGRDVSELGGTTNVTGRALRNMGFGGFLHLEMNPDLRERLMNSPERLQELAECLISL